MIRKGISATAACLVDLPDDVVADVRGITYRVMRTVLRQNTAYIAERSVPERLAALQVPVQGAGLGLSIVAAIAKAHGAEARANSNPGGGLELVVVFAGSEDASSAGGTSE
ncbi:hypothetical protein ACIA8R_33270 [Nonomuraea sp. NPDC051191]|uniref:hypothetical protein n=1 Tax=Nonomuraea sp. NPDC051191 TaxID=3364372 RepID=UPI00379CF61B